MRLIDADKLKKKVLMWMPSDPCGIAEKERPIETDIAVSLMMEIEEAPTIEPEPHWIPCSERLPDAEYGEGDSVLCCTESGLMYILYWDGGNWCVPTGEPYEWVNHITGWHDKVIAWMPLPKPYREDGEA